MNEVLNVPIEITKALLAVKKWMIDEKLTEGTYCGLHVKQFPVVFPPK